MVHGDQSQKAQELARQQLEDSAKENLSLAEAEAEPGLEYLRHREQIRRSEDAQRRIGICKRVVARMLKQQLALAWSTFVECVVDRKHNLETLRRVLSRMTHRVLAGAFACYAGAVETVLAQRERVARTMARWKSTGLNRAMEAWTEYVKMVLGERSKEAQQVAKQQLEEVVRKKQSLAEAEERRIEMCKRVVQRMLRHQMLVAWNLFVHTLVERKHIRETLCKVLSRMRHRELAQAFDCYAGSVNRQVVQRKKLSKTMKRWKATGVKKAWERWADYMEEVWQEVTQQAQELAKEQLEETARANLGMAEAEKTNLLRSENDRCLRGCKFDCGYKCTSATWDWQSKVRELEVECCALKTANGTLEMRMEQLNKELCEMRYKCQESETLAQHACLERERACFSMASVLRGYGVLLPHLPMLLQDLESDESHVRLLQTPELGPQTPLREQAPQKQKEGKKVKRRTADTQTITDRCNEDDDESEDEMKSPHKTQFSSRSPSTHHVLGQRSHPAHRRSTDGKAAHVHDLLAQGHLAQDSPRTDVQQCWEAETSASREMVSQARLFLLHHQLQAVRSAIKDEQFCSLALLPCTAPNGHGGNGEGEIGTARRTPDDVIKLFLESSRDVPRVSGSPDGMSPQTRHSPSSRAFATPMLNADTQNARVPRLRSEDAQVLIRLQAEVTYNLTRIACFRIHLQTSLHLYCRADKCKPLLFEL
jgi:hypothetical protein